MQRICTVQGCDNEVSERSQFSVCPTCRASVYRWMKRKPSEVLERRKRLAKYDRRMTFVTGEENPNLDKTARVLPRETVKKEMRNGDASE